MSQRRCVLLAECLLLQCKENVHAVGESVSLFADTTRRLLIMAQCNLLQAVRGALVWHVLSDLLSRLCAKNNLL